MSTSANSSLDLDDNVPQWKKDLILRKRAQQGLNKPHQQQQLLLGDCTTTTTTSTSSPSSARARGVHSPTSTSTVSVIAAAARGTEGAPLLSNGAVSGSCGGTQNQTAQLTNPATYTPVSCNVSPNKSSSAAASVAVIANFNGKVVNEQCNNNKPTNSAVVSVIKEVKMVQDSVLVMRQPPSSAVATTNGDCCKKIMRNGDGSDSDTSEELQYGPGIVSKLKSKYLSLTLREATIKARPSILPMRRATSLENLLDDAEEEDSGDETTQQQQNGGRRATVSSGAETNGAQPPRRYTPRTNYERSNGHQGPRTQQNRYRNSNRGNDTQKRARSVETLVRSQSDPNDVTNGGGELIINGNDTTTLLNRKPLFDNNMKKPEINNKFASNNCNGQRINRPKRIAPIMDETERPPADLVKQTLMIFEGPAVRRTKAPRSTGDVAAKVANFKNIIDQEKQNNNTTTTPPIVTNNNGKKLGPKPHITGPKPVLISKRGSPVKRPLTPEKPRIDSPELIIKTPPQTPPISPQKTNRPSPIPDISRDTTFQGTENPNRIRTLSETPDLIAHSSPARVFSPTTVKTLTENFIKEEAKVEVPKSVVVKSDQIKDKKVTTPPEGRPEGSGKEVVDGEEKEVTKQSLENISNAGVTVTYRFNNNDSQLAKSHLPRLNTIPVRINRLVPDVPPSPVVTPVKVNGTTPPPVPTRTSSSPRIPAPIQIAPSIPLPTSPEPVHSSSPSIVSATNKNITKTRPPAPPPQQQSTPPSSNHHHQKNLSPREIEKNSINKQKTLEQPISKVVVSMRSVDEVVANKTQSGGTTSAAKKSARQNEQTTILFNFQQRDTIPDYISTDGSSNTRRGKREKPKPGESGIILLPGAPAEEFADDDEDWMLSLNGPPSPCDVHFENDNILIDGKSSISKQPKRQKMRIQFDDDATQIFEYLSESSMINEMEPPQQTTTGHSVPSLSGSSCLASYTPSKMSMTSDFQLGVTRTSQPIVSAPSSGAGNQQNQIESAGNSNGIETETLQPVTYSAETNADILF